MRVAIIGAGPAGLAAIKQCISEKVDCVAYEQSGKIGGVWNYTEQDVDENGAALHNGMYEGLMTNLPKELMEYESFPYTGIEESFIPQARVLDYIHKYAEHFNLLPYVEFYRKVLLVDPLPNNQWTVKTENAKTNECKTETFDGILVCNGHYFDPFYPSIPGMEDFKGGQIHSFYFKKADKYKDKKVLVIGGGLSGVDIAKIVSQIAEKVYFSFRKEKLIGRQACDKSVLKPGIKCLHKNIVTFLDGSQEEIDEIIYCTGYNTIFPFLTKNCKIQVDENHVYPLYKHLINIEYPTMAIINITSFVCPFPLFGLQIRFYLALLKNKFQVTKEKMYEDLKNDIEFREKRGFIKKLAHVIGPSLLEYCEDLAKTASIRKIPPVLGILFKYIIQNGLPKDNYFRIINDEEFQIIPLK